MMPAPPRRVEPAPGKPGAAAWRSRQSVAELSALGELQSRPDRRSVTVFVRSCVMTLHLAPIVAFSLHIGARVLGPVSGTVAILARKGGRLHRRAGLLFSATMLVLAIFAAYLAVAVPGPIANLFIATLMACFVPTSLLTPRRNEGAAGLAEKLGLALAAALAAALCAPFAILASQLATGLPSLFRRAVPFEGTVLIAIHVYASVLAIAAAADAKVVLSGGIRGARTSRSIFGA
jgi:hypothetical protein